jgi:methionine-rich copper-binding protein CopC
VPARARARWSILAALLTAGVATGAAAAVGVTSARAHALVVESDPASGSRLAQAPGSVRIRFNSKIERQLSRLNLVGPDRRVVPLPLAPGDGTEPRPDRLSAALPPLGPGAYAIRWRVLAADGHITEGAIRFTVSAGP